MGSEPSPPGASPTPTTPVVAVVGATATGKSDLAVELALALNGEVVNADAMQLYRGMNVGTAKLTVPERRGVVHHLLDVLDVTQEASVAAYQQQARAAVADIRGRGRVPVLAGGSGLYLSAALDQLDIPPTDPQLRRRLEREAAEAAPGDLHRRLAAVDPQAAARILPGNTRRVVRALEVVELTGRPFSASLPQPRYAQPAVQIGLAAPRALLDARVEARVDRMWHDGLVAEVERLVSLGLRSGRTASRALGYAQVLEQLDGLVGPQQARERTVQATRRFARRQESWFRRDRRIAWFPFDAPDLVRQALAAARAGLG